MRHVNSINEGALGEADLALRLELALFLELVLSCELDSLLTSRDNNGIFGIRDLPLLCFFPVEAEALPIEDPDP